MAKVVETVEREDGHKIAIYESGAQYDLTAGRLVGAPKSAQFTSETSIAARQRQVELKREAIMRGASMALGNENWTTRDDNDVVQEISRAVTLKALNPKDAKQIDAARFILTEAGMAENQTPSSVTPSNMASIGDLAAFAASIARIVSDVLGAKQQIHETIDGTLKD